MVSTTTEQVAAETVMVETKEVNEQKSEVAINGNVNEDSWEKAQKTFQLGKKNLFLNKYDESVNNIEEACQEYTKKYGEFDPNCAEVYFFYGRALLELARVENTVLGNALSGVPEETEPINDSRYGNPDDCSNEEKKEISEKVISALCDGEKEGETDAAMEEKPAEPTTETPAETKCDEKEKPAGEITKETEVAIAEAATEGAEEEEEGGEGEEECDEEEEGDEGEDVEGDDEAAKDEAEAEEISNLQRAWEMFELAKLVYSKNFDSDLVFKNKRIAECLIKLGEISIEQEIYDQAIQDISESIKMQEAEAVDQRDERMLAESFYQLGLAQQFGNYFTEATDSYQKSINIMQFRIEKIKGKMAALKPEEPDYEAQKKTWTEEIAELEALLPEMQCKLEETTEQAQQSVNMIKEAVISTMTSDEGSTPVTQNGEVKDITGMLKSKRKISSSSLDEASKKTRLSAEGTTPEAIETPKAAPLAEPEKMTPECPAPCNEEMKPAAETAVAV
jgi:nuclear autoantigenic sperm protein